MFNMYALSMLGRQIEPFYGRGRFLMLYVLSAFGGNVLSFALSRFNSLGASTAIFGLLAAEGVFIWQNRGVFGKQSQGILMNLAFVLVLNLFIGISPGSNTDNWGHLGGLLAGFSLLSWRDRCWCSGGLKPAQGWRTAEQNSRSGWEL